MMVKRSPANPRATVRTLSFGRVCRTGSPADTDHPDGRKAPRCTISAGPDFPPAVFWTPPRAARDRVSGVLALKRGIRGCTLWVDGERVEGAPYPVEVVNVLGAGDAFASGFFKGLISGWDWTRTARFANAVGAIVVTRHGCSPDMPTVEEVESFIEKQGGY